MGQRGYAPAGGRWHAFGVATCGPQRVLDAREAHLLAEQWRAIINPRVELIGTVEALIAPHH